jgi:hypothetical protein
VNAADIGDTTLHILKAGRIRRSVGNMHDRGNAVRDSFDARGKLANPYLFRTADIIDTARGS